MVILLHKLRTDVAKNDVRCLYLLCSGSFDGGIVKLAAGSDFFDISFVRIVEWHSN